MMDQNLSGETVKCKCCPNSPRRVPELDYNICDRWRGIVPLSLEILLDRRSSYKQLKKDEKDELKQQKYDARQSALKWILVCCLPYDSPVLISQDGKIRYQHIRKIIDDQLGDRVGVFHCTKELLVAGIDKDLKSKFCRVSKLIKTPSPKKLLHVKMDDGRQVRCTSNHSFYILRNGLLVEVKATDLSKGDLIPVAKQIVAHFSRILEGHLRITRLFDSDIGFAAVKEIEQIESSSPYVYCFEISDHDSFPAFFTGSGGVLVHNSFGYLGFKNARFGKIDAHIATCAFSRKVLKQAVALAEAHGFQLVHGIVDAVRLRKPSATAEEYEELCTEISRELNLPISFEGIYKWVVFLNSQIDPRVPVLNRYYGIFQDGTLKVRGIDLRRHDTPGIVRQCQEEMLQVFSKANNSSELKLLIPKALNVLERYATLLRKRKVPLEDLVIEKNLSKDPGEYTHKVPQAIAAQHLVKEGGTVHAGQRVNYILTHDWAGVPEKLAF